MTSRRRMMEVAQSDSGIGTVFYDYNNLVLQTFPKKVSSSLYSEEIPSQSSVVRGPFIGWEQGFFYRALYDLPEAWKGVETISDSWEEIIKSCKDGSYKTKYSLDDTKIVDFKDEGLVLMRIVGFDCDELSDGTGYAHISWMSDHILYSIHRQDALVPNLSNREEYLNEGLFGRLPVCLQSNIVEVKKTRLDDQEGEVTENWRIWIPSYRELFGSSSFETSGVYYESARSVNKRNTGKTPNEGRKVSFCLRTETESGDKEAMVLSGDYTGIIYCYSSDAVARILPCFCV